MKNRIWIWVLAIVICIVAEVLSTQTPSWFEQKDITVYTDLPVDYAFGDVLASAKINSYHCTPISLSNADILIKTASNETIEGYTKHAEVLYSPIVLFVSGRVGDYSGGFIALDKNRDKNSIDLITLIEAVEQGKTWEDLGVHGKVLTGLVDIVIPDTNSILYEYVEEQVYYALNSYKELSEENYTDLKERVDAFLNKCTKVPDIRNAVIAYVRSKSNSNHEDDAECNRVFVAPEFIFSRDDTYFGTAQYYDGCVPCYFPKTVYVKADVYTRSDNSECEEWLNAIRQKCKFTDTTGWRVSGSSFNLEHVHRTWVSTP